MEGYIKLTHVTAAILICALDNYIAEGEVVMQSLSISEAEKDEDVKVLTGTVAALSEANLLKKDILSIFRYDME